MAEELLNPEEEAAAERIAQDILSGKRTARTIEDFKMLMKPSRPGETGPNFGNASLPEDW